MGNNTISNQDNIIDSFQSLYGKEELLAKVIEFFPYPIQIYAPDGTSVHVNKALLNEYHTIDPNMVVGKYNVLKDPSVISTGKLGLLKRAFQGDTVYFFDVRVPLNDIKEHYGINDFDVEAIYQDITLFPILDDMKRVIYVVALLINRRIYRGKDEIEKAKEYLERNWMEKFDFNKTAKAACLSKAHLSKLFKKHTGVTPHEYYVNYKIGKLKEKLRDTNLSITEAFAACNMDYNGYSARVFKAKTGLSPSVYRKVSVQNVMRANP